MQDKRAEFTKVIGENEILIRKIAGFYIYDLNDRQDLIQEIVYQLYRSFDSFKNLSSISTWIYRVAMNTAIYHVKKRKRVLRTISLEEMNDDIVASTSDETEMRLKILHDQIEQLDLLEKGIMLLYLEGKTYDEIAELVGISATNAGTRLSRIKLKLKKQIKNQLSWN
jgi:RNA polymerase sigma-70 factor (ECF subfamily)